MPPEKRMEKDLRNRLPYSNFALRTEIIFHIRLDLWDFMLNFVGG